MINGRRNMTTVKCPFCKHESDKYRLTKNRFNEIIVQCLECNGKFSLSKVYTDSLKTSVNSPTKGDKEVKYHV